MSGRTTWWAKDAAWHRRELQVELGDEFGPAGLLVLDVLTCWAQEQRSSGEIRGGFRGLARETFIDHAEARAIVERAAAIGAIDDLDIDPDGRRFACRVSGFRADQERGRAAWRKATQREREAAETTTDTPEPAVTLRDVSRSVTRTTPPDQTRPDQTGEEQPSRGRASRTPAASEGGEEQQGSLRLAEDIVGVLQRGVDSLTTDEPCKRPTVAVILAALREHPVDAMAAMGVAVETRCTVQSQDRAPNIAGLFRQKLAARAEGASA